ncbi:hypothetical protein HMPREF9412_6329 [Paenibacillus sp. HGF5]|nr:hypothetical protein HMPREF9412_6329 [Paenibacillus sp. HGF5]
MYRQDEDKTHRSLGGFSGRLFILIIAHDGLGTYVSLLVVVLRK